MRKQATVAAITAVLLLALTGCGEEAAPAAEPKSFAAPLSKQAEETPAVEETAAEPAIGYGPTAPGEVCDLGNANDSLCAAFYPDQAVINIAGRGSALSDIDPPVLLNLAELACEEMRAGGTWEASALSSGDDNRVLYAAAAVGYCPEYAPGGGNYPDRTSRLITFYKSLGESGAKAHFSDKVMPTEAELGY